MIVQVVYTRTDVETVSTTYRIQVAVKVEDPEAFLKAVNEDDEDALDILSEGHELEFLQVNQEVLSTDEVGKPQGKVFITASP